MSLRVAIAAATSVFLLVLSGSAAFADDDDEKERLLEQQQTNELKLEELQSSLEGVDVDLQAAYLNLEQIRNEIPIAQNELARAQSELSAAQREQQRIAGQLDAARAELDTIEDEIRIDSELSQDTQVSLNELARSAYRGDTVGSQVDMWFTTNSTDDFLGVFAATNSIARTESALIREAQTQVAMNENRLVRQVAVEEDIADLQREADAIVADLEAKEADAQARTATLASLEEDEVQYAAELEDRRADFQASMANVEAAQESTASRIAEIDAENARRAEEAARLAREQPEADRRAQAEEEARQNVAPAPSPNAPTTAPSPPSSSGTTFVPPVPAPVYVTSPFGMRWYPITGGYWMHNGVDLRSVCGEGQVATAAGVVTATRPAAGNGTHGNQVFVNHGIINGSSYVSVYNHLGGFAVSPGQSVSQGQVVGYTGQTGQVTGCHVHFEIWKDGSVIDPMSQAGFTRRN